MRAMRCIALCSNAKSSGTAIKVQPTLLLRAVLPLLGGNFTDQGKFHRGEFHRMAHLTILAFETSIKRVTLAESLAAAVGDSLCLSVSDRQ